MEKYIHYCWFGDKSLPKLAEKCIKSWEKFLPDFKIMKWSEENVDLEECPFIKEAYANKKWAFVADYVRAKVLKEYGGIYFDTDMEVTKDISTLLDTTTFLGIEDSGYVAVGVWYEKKKDAYLPSLLCEKYKKMPSFPIEDMSSISIPILISGILNPLGLIHGNSRIQVLKHDITIYPRDYFYPYSYNRDHNLFTEHTCMIHYYDASWIPLKCRIENEMVRKLGKKRTFMILEMYRRGKHHIRQIGKCVLFPLVLYKRHQRKMAKIDEKYIKRIQKTKNTIEMLDNRRAPYIIFHNGDWFGITSATKELFENLVDCDELYRQKDIREIGDIILSSHIKQVIFSSFALGWKDLAVYLRSHNQNIILKTYWHGNHSQVLDPYGWRRNLEIVELHKKGVIDVMGTCKKSLMDFYKKEGFDAFFLTNKVEMKVKAPTAHKKLRIGLYAATCYDWRKNVFSQIAAVKMIEGATLDIVPYNEEVISFAKIIGLEVTGSEKPLPREELMKRMGANAVNLYVTFSECAPMLPLESFEMGTPCITGNNHHYFENSNLENLIVVSNEEDILEICEKIKNCMEQKDKIMNLYKKFRSDNIKNANKSVKEFLER